MYDSKLLFPLVRQVIIVVFFICSCWQKTHQNFLNLWVIWKRRYNNLEIRINITKHVLYHIVTQCTIGVASKYKFFNVTFVPNKMCGEFFIAQWSSRSLVSIGSIGTNWKNHESSGLKRFSCFRKITSHECYRAIRLMALASQNAISYNY